MQDRTQHPIFDLIQKKQEGTTDEKAIIDEFNQLLYVPVRTIFGSVTTKTQLAIKDFYKFCQEQKNNPIIEAVRERNLLA